MTFTQIRDFCTAKVGKTDNYTKARCEDFIAARHRTIYESFPWKAAQTIVTLTADGGGNTSQTTIVATGLSHVISVRVKDELLDPVATSYVFESAKVDFDTPTNVPKFYDVFYSDTDQTPTIRFYPPLNIDENAGTLTYEVVVLGKLPLDDAATHVAIPHTENSLIAFVLGDLWEYMHQVAKAQAKFTEAQALLKEAQDSDTPASMRPRMSVSLTATGNSLAELTDSVCNIIGKFDPDTRISVKERIRRNYQLIADAALWPELSITAAVDVQNTDYVVLPPHFDKVIAVRTNTMADDLIHTPYQLKYMDQQLWFGINPEVFESQGQRVSYSMMPPSGIGVLMPPPGQQILFSLSAPVGQSGPDIPIPPLITPERIKVFIRGFHQGRELYETVTVVTATAGYHGPPDPVGTTVSANTYDDIVTLSKPITRGTLNANAFTTLLSLVELEPERREKRHIRLFLLPPDSAQVSTIKLKSVFVFGKMKIAPLVDDQDSCQIRDVENILINATAADLLFQLGQTDRAMMLKQKAEQNMQTLATAATTQSAYEPTILPYTETQTISADTL